MTRLTEQGHAVFGNLTERGRLVVGALTDAARAVFGQTAAKTGGATADLEAGGTLARTRKRKRVIVLPIAPRQASIFVKAGGATLRSAAAGARRTERLRSGGATSALSSGAEKRRVYRARAGGGLSRRLAAGTKLRDLAPRHGGGSAEMRSHSVGVSLYAEMGSGRAIWRADGMAAALRGDDSDELFMLGLVPEEDDVLVLL
jgi:hypothetical protein